MYIYIYEWRVSCIYVYKYISIRKCVCIQIVKRGKRSYLNFLNTPFLFACSLQRLAHFYCTYCWKHLSFQERKVFTKFKRSKRRTLLISFEYNLLDKIRNKWTKEMYFTKYFKILHCIYELSSLCRTNNYFSVKDKYFLQEFTIAKFSFNSKH